MSIDRIGPTRRPAGPNAGTQTWRDLLFAHWVLPAEAIRPLVPRALELDGYEGRYYVGVVPFVMRSIRFAWMPRGTGLDFLETNLRTYVRNGERPGVYFFSLEASSWLAVKVARTVWSLPYFHASMHIERKDASIDYETVRKSGSGRLKTRFAIGEPLGPSEPGTLEHFLLERYLLFSEKNGRIFEGQVHHVPYPAHRAQILEMDQDLLEAAGLPRQETLPSLAHFSPGVDVEVFGPYPV